jgi:hypothetical protein
LEISGSVDDTLRASLGSRRFLDLQRITRKAETFAKVAFYTKDELAQNPEMIAIAGQLHAENAKKYGHPFNMYDAAALQRILDSPLGEHLVIGLVADTATAKIVQVILALVDKARGHVFYLAQGAVHEEIPSNINLYTASYLWIYRYAESIGAKTIFLSRGMHEAKRRMGANKWILLNNWLYSENPETLAVISLARAQAEKLIVPGYQAFRSQDGEQ